MSNRLLRVGSNLQIPHEASFRMVIQDKLNQLVGLSTAHGMVHMRFYLYLVRIMQESCTIHFRRTPFSLLLHRNTVLLRTIVISREHVHINNMHAHARPFFLDNMPINRRLINQYTRESFAFMNNELLHHSLFNHS